MRIFHGSIIPMSHRLGGYFPDFVLTSFIYKEFKSQNWERIYNDPNVTLFLDSGAFTIIRSNPPSVDELHKFVLKYRDFIVEYYDNIYTFAELDIEQSYSQKQVDYWFDLLSEVDPQNKIMRVWHCNHSMDRFKQYVNSDLRFVGLGGDFQLTSIPKKTIISMLVYAYKNRKMTHGFGFSSDLLKEYPFYSIDSTRWLVPGKYGGALVFDHKTKNMKRLQSAHYISKLKNRRMPKKDALGDKFKKNKQACIEINKYVDFCTRLWRKRGIDWDDIEKENSKHYKQGVGRSTT